MVDAEDHKCFEACASTAFKTKGINDDGKCPSQYDTIDKTQVVLQCPDGVTSVRYCPATAMNVTIYTRGEKMGMNAIAMAAPVVGLVHMIEHSPGDHCLEVNFPGGTDSAFWKSNGWKYSAPIRPEWKTGECDKSKWTSTDATSGNYDGFAGVTLTKYGFGTLVEAMDDEYCLHQEDTEDHKCFEACSAAGTFKTKGIKGTGKCPAKYTTLDKTVDVQQCSDGVTSIRYCKPIKVTIATKGEAGGLDTLLALMKTADVMRHQIKGNHCGDLFVEFEKDSTLDRVNDWWSANSYKYESYEKGLCPTVQFRTVDHLEHPIGVKGVTMRDMGMNAIAMAAPVVGLVHMIERSPGDHCLEVNFPGGTDSAFWKSNGWKYSAPIRPEWKTGGCDKSKWTSTDATSGNYDGFAGVTLTKYGFGSKDAVETFKCNSHQTIKACKSAGCNWSHFGCLDRS